MLSLLPERQPHPVCRSRQGTQNTPQRCQERVEDSDGILEQPFPESLCDPRKKVKHTWLSLRVGL
jgi:hypothetical protein